MVFLTLPETFFAGEELLELEEGLGFLSEALSSPDVIFALTGAPLVVTLADVFVFDLANLPANIQYVTDPAVDGTTTTDTNVSFNVNLIVDCSSAQPALPNSTLNIRVNGSTPTSVRWLNGNLPPASPDALSVYLLGFTIL